MMEEFCTSKCTQDRSTIIPSVMARGDGDEVELKPIMALKIMAHELTHGIIDASAGLVYAGGSGRLNEATSDIMGIMVDFYRTDPSLYNPNYLLVKLFSLSLVNFEKYDSAE